MNDEIKARALTVAPLVEEIKPILAGQPAEIQGAVIADLLSIYLAGHPEIVRAKVLEMTLRCAQNMLEPNLHIMFPKGIPPEWRRQ